MTLRIKLKKRWITSVLNEAKTGTPALPWQVRRQILVDHLQRQEPPRKSKLIQA